MRLWKRRATSPASLSAALLLSATVLVAVVHGQTKAPYFANDTFNTATSLLVKFESFEGVGIGGVIAYEVSYRSLFNTEWNAQDGIGASGYNISEVQVVSIRVDQTATLSGSFFLGIERHGSLVEDFQVPSRTPRIQYSATASDMKAALASISSITVREVRRCDQINLLGDSSPVKSGLPITMSGEYQGWVNGCPYNQNSEGGFRWLIVFDTPAAGGTVPTLFVYKNELKADTWKGTGPQILVTRITRSLVNPSLCLRQGCSNNATGLQQVPQGSNRRNYYLTEDCPGRSFQVCSYNVTGLQPGTPYMFRTRTLTEDYGWTDYSKTSELKTTLEMKPPSRPKPPIVSSSSAYLANLNFPMPSASQQVLFFESQYRLAGDVYTNKPWIAGPYLDVVNATRHGERRSQSLIITLTDLQPDTAYVARVRATNHFGPGVYSAPSDAFTTSTDLGLLSVPPTPQVAIDTPAPVTSSSVDILVSANPSHLLPATSTTYKLQYKIAGSSRVAGDMNWRTAPDTIVFQAHKQGVEIQDIISRSTGGFVPNTNTPTYCYGNFWLNLGVVEHDNVGYSVTPPLSFDASIEDMTKAIYSIGAVAQAKPRVTVHRTMNSYNGYSWRVEIQGMGDVTRLQLFKHTLYAVAVGDDDLVKVGPCYSVGGVEVVPLFTSTVKNGGDVFQQLQSVVTVGGLQPSTGYLFRTQLMNPSLQNYNGPISNTTYAMTLPPYEPLDPADVLTIGMDGIATTNRNVNAVTNPRRDHGKATGPPITVSGALRVAAKTSDPQYIEGAGMGGLSAINGEDGVCVLITYNARKGHPNTVLQYFFTGSPQTYTVPDATPQDGFVGIVTIKCWGGGGGGAKLADLGLNEVRKRDNPYLRHLSIGGGAAFAQISVYTNPGDTLTITVAGGGTAPDGQGGGIGGYGGGGRGGDGIVAGGGGGGGASSVKLNNVLLLVAAGGGGGGSTEYCCAGGGAGGRMDSGGLAGSYPGPNTPWPLSFPDDSRPTPLTRRSEYTSSACPTGANGLFCLSEWDVLPGSLPAEHENIEWGAEPRANYTVWATSGMGGGPSAGGISGISGSFAVRLTGQLLTLNFPDSSRPVAVFDQSGGVELRGKNGLSMQGGDGAGGRKGGGGGGGGYWGGGGGGSGLYAGGGGGGCSYVDVTVGSAIQQNALSADVPTPSLLFVNESSVILSWTLRWDRTVWGSATSFAIEQALGPDSQDFSLAGSLDTSPNYQAPLAEVANFTVSGLSQDTSYSFRVVPIFPKGRGLQSNVLVVRTLSYAINYWEPVVTRRLSLATSGRGFSNPVTDPESANGAIERPHLTPGVQIVKQGVSSNPMRFTDPDTASTKALPSPRRGHSLTFVAHSGLATQSALRPAVYMFGGRSDGYSCALTYKDTLDIGTPQSGIPVYPCTSLANEVSETWSFDIHTYQWRQLDLSQSNAPVPPPREQHAAAMVNNNIYVFGGKARHFDIGSDGQPILKMHSDIVHGDFFVLNVPRSKQLVLPWPATDAPLPIAQDGRVFVTINGSVPSLVSSEGKGVSARNGDCIESVVVKVTLRHQCFNQLRISIMGPGPQTGSPNYHAPASSHEVLLFNQRKTNGTGCISGTQTFIFDESSPVSLDACCKSSYSGAYFPEGRLSEYVGASTSNEWTLVVQDMKPDDLSGSLLGWEIEFVVSPCVWSYSWTDLSDTITGLRGPQPRSGATTAAYGEFLFVFGGRDVNSAPLQDLFRFNTNTQVWDQLTPVNFYNVALNTANSVGANFMLTSWGLLRYGGYFRQPYMNDAEEGSEQYTSDLFLEDPSTLRWRKVAVEPWPGSLSDGTTDPKPNPRYFSAAAFIPSSTIAWRRDFSYRSLYDKYQGSRYSNYASALADSVLVFGGHDATTGSMYDGSTGGLLNDMWLLRLSNLSTAGTRAQQQQYLERQCLWRRARAESCLSKAAPRQTLPRAPVTPGHVDGTPTGQPTRQPSRQPTAQPTMRPSRKQTTPKPTVYANVYAPPCSFRDLVMLTWCAGGNVTMQ